MRANKIVARSDEELLPALLDILGSVTPVDKWPTQKEKKAGKKRRIARAREDTHAQAAAADREGPSPLPARMPAPWAEQTHTIDTAVDSDRRRRREEVVLDEPVAPPLLEDALRRQHLFLLPLGPDDHIDQPLEENA